MDSWVAKYWHKLFSEKEQQGKYCHPMALPPAPTNQQAKRCHPLHSPTPETTHKPAYAKIPPLPPPLALSIWKWVTRESFFVSLSSFSSFFHLSAPPMRPPSCPSSSPLSTLPRAVGPPAQAPIRQWKNVNCKKKKKKDAVYFKFFIILFFYLFLKVKY
jgi:hypothetical protein